MISKSILITCYLLQSIKCKPQGKIKRKDGRGGTRSEGAGARGGEARRDEQWRHGEGDEDQSTKDKVQWLAKAK